MQINLCGSRVKCCPQTGLIWFRICTKEKPKQRVPNSTVTEGYFKRYTVHVNQCLNIFNRHLHLKMTQQTAG